MLTQLAIQIIKFRSDFREFLFNKMMKIVFELDKEENHLKIKVYRVNIGYPLRNELLYKHSQSRCKNFIRIFNF
jgi:hypothetical protein